MIHFYAGYPTLSRMTVDCINSFTKLGKVSVWVPKNIVPMNWVTGEQKGRETLEDYGAYLDEGVVCRTAPDFHGLPVNAQSDLFRYWILYEEGGVYADCDILWRQGSLPPNFATSGNGYFSTGLLGCEKPGNPYFKNLLDNWDRFYDPNDYQSLGPSYFNKVGCPLPNLRMETWLPVPYNRVPQFYDDNKLIPAINKRCMEALAVHFFGAQQPTIEYEKAYNQRKEWNCLATRILRGTL